MSVFTRRQTQRRIRVGRPGKSRLGVEALEQRRLLASVTLPAAIDTTLFEDLSGTLSNGAGEFLFVGRTAQPNGSIRRAMIAFDLTNQFDQGAVITGATLSMNMSRTIVDNQSVSLHRILGKWGEGTSDANGEEGKGTAATANDSTWLQRQFGAANWNTPGGDFQSASSASTMVGDVGQYSWSSAQMVADIQSWLANPNSNFGWMMVGNEAVSPTAKRFDSRENSDPSKRPSLTIEFETAAPPSISISDAAELEGDSGTKTMGFPVTLDGSITEPVTISFATESEGAMAGEDFEPTSGSIEFTPDGPKEQVISVNILGDVITEDDEHFIVRLTSQDQVQFDKAQAEGAIKNDDAPPQIDIVGASTLEGNQGTNVVRANVVLTNPSAFEITVNFATDEGSADEGVDYVAAAGEIVFAPGETTRPIEVTIRGDTELEDTETVFIKLSDATNASIATASATIEIVNDDSDEFPWHNILLPEDVTGDGLVVPFDALLVINEINSGGSRELPIPPVPPNLPPPYLDVSGDNHLSPIDALFVINFINDALAAAATAAEAASAETPLLTKTGSIQLAAAALTDEAGRNDKMKLIQPPRAARKSELVATDAAIMQLFRA